MLISISWHIKIILYLHREVPFDFLVCRGVLLLIDVYHLKKIFSSLRTPFPQKIDRRHLKKSTFLKKNLKKFWRFRNFWVLNVADICATRGAPPMIQSFRFFNPGTFLGKLVKLRSSEIKRLLNKSLLFAPPGDYLL